MSSPLPDDPMDAVDHVHVDEEGVPSDEEEGEPTMMSDDSSEEEEEDEEAVRKVREGFIVDEDEEEGEEEGKRERRRRKHKRRRVADEDEDMNAELDEDDLMLVEENTGQRIAQERFSRIARHQSLEPDEAPPRKRPRMAKDDESDEELPDVDDLAHIFDEDRRAAAAGDDEGEDLADVDDMDDFIEEDEFDDEEDRNLNDEEREMQKMERRRVEKERRKAIQARPELAGIDRNAWDEIYDVFGDGNDYQWALDDDETVPAEEAKTEMNYQDVFEPSEIKARMLTNDDDLIRNADIPERMQLTHSSLSPSATLNLAPAFNPEDLNEASYWVALRISPRIKDQFFVQNGRYHHLLASLIMAVSHVIESIFIKQLEVPFIWTHRRDHLSHFDPEVSRTRTELLLLDEVWKIQSIGETFRAFAERKRALRAAFDALKADDEYFERQMFSELNTIEMVADASDWLTMKYKRRMRDMVELNEADGADAGANKVKKPSRTSEYDIIRNTPISHLADRFGLAPHEVVLNLFNRGERRARADEDLMPLVFAEQFTPEPIKDEKPEPPEQLLAKARFLLATDLGRDPLLRKHIRDLFEEHAVISVKPTEKGIVTIDEYHPYFRFKYLSRKPVSKLRVKNTLFLQILAAESALLVNATVSLPDKEKAKLQQTLYEAYASDKYSDVAHAWNQQRRLVVEEAVERHLIPTGVKWIREWLREEEEEALSEACGGALEDRIDRAPYRTADLEEGDIPTVLAVSWGKGDPQHDAITCVYMDEEGRMREHTKFDNIKDEEMKDAFKEFVKRRKPDVIGVAGLTAATARLMEEIKRTVGRPEAPKEPERDRGRPNGDEWGRGADGWGGGAEAWGSGANAGVTGDAGWGARANGDKDKEKDKDGERYPDIIYVLDDVARIYQHSRRAAEEFSGLSVIARYCVGLARYVQNPLNEYAALGEDVGLIQFSPDQKLLPRNKLLAEMERRLVTIVNKVTVDINRAVSDNYYQHLLRFVCGLGPRKAQSVIRRITMLGGTVVNRNHLATDHVLTWNIFNNAAAFLRIAQDPDYKEPKRRSADNDDQPDPLDETRVHPEDYELARKMAIDALELDDEDVAHEHPSAVVAQLMHDDDCTKKLDDLSLDDFAVNLLERLNDRKRHTLDMIKEELVNPSKEKRMPYELLDGWGILTMLTGETRRTLYIGRPVSVLVYRVKPQYANCRLDSGVECVINHRLMHDDPDVRAEDFLSRGQTVNGIVIDVVPDKFLVEVSTQESALKSVHPLFQKHGIEDFDLAQHERDQEALARKKQREVNSTRRIIKHPEFRNFTSGQAEQYLSKRPKGDFVIRPSSKGPDHLVVTWKVEEGVFQHIDVYDPDGSHDQSGVGHRLIVGKDVYTDLDELLVSHVGAMARRVNDLMEHEKFNKGNVEQRRQFLTEYVMANPNKSVYVFGLDRQHPGYFSVDFMVNKSTPLVSWPVKVTPHGYRLQVNERDKNQQDPDIASVPELCNAFKTRYLQQMITSGTARGAAGGRTPYGGAGGMTPSGRATPGHLTSSHNPIGRTPNPYGANMHTPNPYAGHGPYPPQSPHPATTGWGTQPQGAAAGGWSGGGNSRW